MKSSIRQPAIDVPVPVQVFNDLCAYRERSGDRRDLALLAGTAIAHWLALQAQQPALHAGRRAVSGYQWKNVFLPSGTLLRTLYRGQPYHAAVDGDDILFDGRKVSPSEFVNGLGGAARNAWQRIWILFPNEATWLLAAHLRNQGDLKLKLNGLSPV